MLKATKQHIPPLFLALLALVLALALAPAAQAGPGEVSAAATSERSYYLAEGCTREGFETWLTVANLNDGTPFSQYVTIPSEPFWRLEVVYTTNEGVVATKTYDLPKQSRTTINVNAEIGAGYDVSFAMTYTTNLPGNSTGLGGVWVERPMYFSYTGRGGHLPWQGGHVNAASSPWRARTKDPLTLPTRQYFAEGTTRQDPERHFDEWLCVLNPNDAPAQLTFNYMVEGEGLQARTGTVEARHRATFYVADHVGLNKDVSLELVSDVGVLAERPMYFAYRSVNPARPGRAWYGGHVITGVPEHKLEADRMRTFAFAPVAYVEGLGWADTWVCMQNPNEVEVPVELTFSTPAGLAYFIKWLPPQQRSTFYYPALLAEYGVASSRDPGAFRVQPVAGHPQNILVERPLYMEFDRVLAGTGQLPSGGTVISGTPWYTRAVYAEGYTGEGFDEWLALSYFEQSQTFLDAWELALTEKYLNSGTWFCSDCYFPGGGFIDDYRISVRRVWESGYEGPWSTYMWHVNDDFPHTDISIHTEQRIFAERIMIFRYAGKWTGMHSSGQGCRGL